MITIEKFKEFTQGLPDQFLIKMSCSNKEYTLMNPSCADNGTIYYDGYGFEFVIDWNNSRRYTLGEFRTLLENQTDVMVEEITSTDIDDNNTIYFEDLILINEDIILV